MQNNFNQYGYQQPGNYYQQVKMNQYAFVNGIEGAKSFMMQPNQMVMLLDSDEPIIYKKTSNGYGQATVEAFRMVPLKEAEQPSHEYVLKSDFDSLVARVDKLIKKDGDE